MPKGSSGPERNDLNKSALVNIEEVVSDKNSTPPAVENANSILCGFNIGQLPRPIQLCVCIITIFVLFLLYGYCQEWIFRVEEIKKQGMFITLIQFGMYSLFGIVEQKRMGSIERRIPLQAYFLLAFLTIGTMGLSNTSLGYLNYPTQVIFKSSKLIPVMIGGILIQGKVYTMFDALACILMTIGLILFTYADHTVSPNFDFTGIILISLALCADAAIGNVQEKVLKKYEATNAELVLYSYGIGFGILCIGHVTYGGLFSLILFIFKNPWVLFMLFLFSLTGYIGILFVLQVVRTFGALLAVTVTTCRKAVTIVLSFIFFSKPFTLQYVWAGLLVMIGILLNVYSKNKSKIHVLLHNAYNSAKRSDRTAKYSPASTSVV